MDLFSSGIRPAVDEWLLGKSKEVRSYGDYWSASSAGYCHRKLIFERLGVPHVTKEDDARKQRVFTAGHLFHDWMQRITKEAGLSIAQELELQDEELMIRGHIDDLVLVGAPLEFQTDWDNIYNKNLKINEDGTVSPKDPKKPSSFTTKPAQHLILYDYKTRNSRNFNFSKTLSFYHKMQLGTYMYMLRNVHKEKGTLTKHFENAGFDTTHPYTNLTEARILNIEKDTLRMSEVQLLWSPELEKEVLDYWTQLNEFWIAKKLPPCTCDKYENGFMAKEQWNPYFFNEEPCSMQWLTKTKEEGLWRTPTTEKS